MTTIAKFFRFSHCLKLEGYHSTTATQETLSEKNKTNLIFDISILSITLQISILLHGMALINALS